MRLHSAKAEAKGEELVINPRAVEGASVHADGTLVYLGAEELVVQEPYALVAQQLEDAWEAVERNKVLDAVLEKLEPLVPLLPAIVAQMVVKAKGGPAPAPTPPAPAPVQPSDVKTSTPPDVVIARDAPMEQCRNCQGRFPAQAKCPGCGATLVGAG